MYPEKRLLKDAYAKLTEAENLLELLCRRHKTCTTCPIRVPDFKNERDESLPGDGDDRCLYHVLSADIGNNWNEGYKACRTCAHFHKGSCSLDRKDTPVDELLACSDYTENEGSAEE